MIQRIQTVYLFLIVVLQSILLWKNNIAEYSIDGETTVFQITNIMSLALLTILTAMIPAISLFMYKKRTTQMRFNIFNSILLVVQQLYILYFVVKCLNEDKYYVEFTTFFPIISLILSVLAIKKIFRDELLIKSLSTHRLRKK